MQFIDRCEHPGMKRFAQWIIGATMLCAMAQPTQAQQFPQRPITIVVGYAASGGTDLVARILGEQMGKQIGRPVLIDNKPGANGSIAATQVARATSDGYTLLMMGIGSTIAAALFRNLNYDPIKSFAPIGMVATQDLVIVAHPSLRITTLQELIAATKAKPNTIFFASPGVGSAQHVAMEGLKVTTGMQIDHVGFKGGGQAINAVISGEVPLGILGIVPVLPHIRSGTLKPLATTGAKRAALLPDVPTVREVGVAGFVALNWFALVAPAGTPASVIDRLHAEVAKAMRAPGMAERLAVMGVDVSLSDRPADLARFLREDLDKWPPIIKAGNITVN